MKTTHADNLERRLRRAEADVIAQIRALFGRCPDLSGFSLQDREPARNEIDPGEGELSITDIGFCPAVSEREYEEVRGFIDETINDLVNEHPEALGILRNRTFVRTLH